MPRKHDQACDAGMGCPHALMRAHVHACRRAHARAHGTALTHALMHALTHSRTHTHARTHARTRARTREQRTAAERTAPHCSKPQRTAPHRTARAPMPCMQHACTARTHGTRQLRHDGRLKLCSRCRGAFYCTPSPANGLRQWLPMTRRWPIAPFPSHLHPISRTPPPPPPRLSTFACPSDGVGLSSRCCYAELANSPSCGRSSFALLVRVRV